MGLGFIFPSLAPEAEQPGGQGLATDPPGWALLPPSAQPCPAGMGRSQTGRAVVGLAQASSPSSPHWQRCWHRGTRPVWVRGTAGTDAPTPVPAWPSPHKGWEQAANPATGVGGAGGEARGQERCAGGAQPAAAPSSWEPRKRPLGPRSCGWAPCTALLLLPAAARAGKKPAWGPGEQNCSLGSGRRELKANYPSLAATRCTELHKWEVQAALVWVFLGHFLK